MALAPVPVAAGSDSHDYRLHAADADVFKRDDHEPAPDCRTFEFAERQRATPCNISLATADRFLQQAADDPWIGDNGLYRQVQMGVHPAGQPLPCWAKCVAHDVSEKLI